MSIDRKAAVTAWKERKSAPGIYAIRCVPTGEVWMGQAADVATVQNRHWFALRMGSHTNRALQAAWQQHGADALVFESWSASQRRRMRPCNRAGCATH